MTERPVAKITFYPDGPILVRGSYRIVDETGREIERPRRTVALCRCGKSSQKPWCDGTHKAAGFRADGRPLKSAGS
jgi:CDGSH-type Zn-finger protein